MEMAAFPTLEKVPEKHTRAYPCPWNGTGPENRMPRWLTMPGPQAFSSRIFRTSYLKIGILCQIGLSQYTEKEEFRLS